MIFGSRKRRPVVGIGLDGFPYTLACKLIERGVMPNLGRLAERGTLKQISSVLPTVSGVAWSGFQTGRTPGEFGVYGFVDLRPDFDLFIPNRTDLKCETIWERLERAGRKFASLGVPMTYPAPKLDAFLVTGFLAPKLDERAVSNAAVLRRLQADGYEIDTDPAVGVQSPERFKEELTRVSEARQRTALGLLAEREWDLFFLHVMDTDRLGHFLWQDVGDEGAEGSFFLDFCGRIDGFLGRVADLVGDEGDLFLCSDHGFCRLDYEVQLNFWLRQEGYLDLEDAPQKVYKAVRPGSRALALVPGRIHILTSSRWSAGAVGPAEYEPLRAELVAKLRDLKHPPTGRPVCKRVLTKEEAFHGPYLDAAPDIVIDPHDGFDLKAKPLARELFETGPRSGMHTFWDAMLLTSDGLDDLALAENITEVGRRLADHLL